VLVPNRLGTAPLTGGGASGTSAPPVVIAARTADTNICKA